MLGLLAASCAHEVSRPNPVGPPAPHGLPYVGRVVVETPALREQVEAYESAWTRRLMIVGATATITYDDDRAVVDVYSAQPTSLDRIASLLVDAGGWQLDSFLYRSDGILVTWLPPTEGCACSGRVRVAIDRLVLCQMSNEGDHTLMRPGATATLFGKLRWLARRSDGTEMVTQAPSDRSHCPDKDIWPDSILFSLPAGLTDDMSIALVLGLAGGTLPQRPNIASVTPARGAR
jgi:hypothetical protein